MNLNRESTLDDWLSLLDIDAIAEPSDKVAECRYFLELASHEKEKDKFRWLISAFLGAAYSFFEINALRAYESIFNPETGDAIENCEALTILRKYVRVSQNPKNPGFVNTTGNHEITNKLYMFRKQNTHHYPLSIMTTAENTPISYHFGSTQGNGVPVLRFCQQVLELIFEVESELQRHS